MRPDVPLHAHELLARIGNTPLLALEFRPEKLVIHAKAEQLNPSGSVKDRLARCLLLDARERGVLRPDTVVLECSSGNTGIALAMAGAALGVRVAIAIARHASPERARLLTLLGAEVRTFDASGGYGAGIELCRGLAAEDARYFLTDQFANPLNARDHEETTGPEIFAQAGHVDAFVAGYGTGGTLTGVGRALRQRCPRVEIIAVEPTDSELRRDGAQHCLAVEGVARCGFSPPLLDPSLVTLRETVTAEDAFAMTRRLAAEFGLLVGPSSGANVLAAVRTAQRLGRHARVVTLLCDRAERYFSTALFDFAGAKPKLP